MPKRYIPAIIVAVLGVGVATFAATTTRSSSTATTCTRLGTIHIMTIKNGMFSPASLTVPRCDRIEVINSDPVARLIALGRHDHHIAYPGFTEQFMGGNDHFTFTATKAESFPIHDHTHDQTIANITVH